MSNAQPQTGYSANIRLWIEVDGRTHDLSQVADEWIMPTTAWDQPPAPAVVVVEIDGRQHRRRVTLPQGVSPTDRFVPVHDAPGDAGWQALAV